MAIIASILWRSFNLPGYEFCQLLSQGSGWQLQGSALFSHEQQPCRLDYEILCDTGWQTLSANVKGWVGSSVIDIQVRRHAGDQWRLNNVKQPELTGCTDLDLNFSPSTNLLPIRRLNLSIGQAADVRAAWLRFPSFRLEPLPQQYRRLAERIYRYESSGGRFAADLKVDQLGLVLDYPGLWQAEALDHSSSNL